MAFHFLGLEATAVADIEVLGAFGEQATQLDGDGLGITSASYSKHAACSLTRACA
jgi:hypothetical protein